MKFSEAYQLASIPASYRTAKTTSRPRRPYLKVLLYVLCLWFFMSAATAGVKAYTHRQQVVHKTLPTMKYTVQQGETLWQIAESLNKDQTQDSRVIVNDILELNHMTDATIHPGQVLLIPVEGR